MRRKLLALLAVRRRFAWYGKLKRLRMYGTPARSRIGLRYLALDPELDNFTYDIENRAELARTLADVLRVDVAEIERYIAEADSDRRVSEPARGRPVVRLRHKRVMPPGRRLGWYATARVLRPSLIVETGIHGGLGSRLLLLALARNREEGAPGELVSIDIDTAAGALVERPLRTDWQPVFGSTYDVLKPAISGRRVGMLIHDSDHTYECERFEFEAALGSAGDRIALISDNAHASSALPDVAKEHGMAYAYFVEEPRDHFYPGAGLGIALRGA